MCDGKGESICWVIIYLCDQNDRIFSTSASFVSWFSFCFCDANWLKTCGKYWLQNLLLVPWLKLISSERLRCWELLRGCIPRMQPNIFFSFVLVWSNSNIFDDQVDITTFISICFDLKIANACLMRTTFSFKDFCPISILCYWLPHGFLKGADRSWLRLIQFAVMTLPHRLAGLSWCRMNSWKSFVSVNPSQTMICYTQWLSLYIYTLFLPAFHVRPVQK